jgi:hypothetical protein
MPKLRRNGQVFDGLTGQLLDSPTTLDAPSDVPAIVERYQKLVGSAIAVMEAKAKEKTLQSKDLNAISALGRSVAMLQVMESANITRVGGKAVKEIPTAQLRKLIGATDTSDEEGNE